jgi:peptide/nickel transport system ATP-binding protein
MVERASQSPVLDVKDLTVEYVTPFHRTPAVRGLSLNILEGEVYGLVGESGCGKSTTALACMRYLPAGTRIEGQVNLLSENMLTMGSRRLREMRGNRIAMVYQDPLQALNPSMPIMKQMAEILTIHEGVSARTAREQCLEILELVRIADPVSVAQRYPHQLSGGMQQRVIIAMALLLKPSLLIMDEPTTGLDVTIEAAVLDLVNDLRYDLNTAILFISHNLGVIARLCDRVGVMYAGEMVEEAPVIDLFKTPRHPYTMGLLRCLPRKGASRHDNPLWSIPGRVPPLHSLPGHCVFASRCAMTQPRCLDAHPALERIGPGRRSRCFYWNQLSPDKLRDEPGPLPDLTLTNKRRPTAGDLEVQDLHVQFRVSKGFVSLGLGKSTVKAVDGISINLPARSTLGVVGESGCGKSTLARTIAGLVPIHTGQIRLAGEDLNRPVSKRPAKVLQMLQMVFQNPDSTLNPQKTVAEELRRPLRLFQMVDRRDEDRTIGQLLAAVNLDESYMQRYPTQLSGGERQRVAIARAFAGYPQLVLCDEPTSSLDVSVQSMVLNLLQRLQDDFGVSLMFISHDLSVVRYVSDFIAVVYLGRLCEFGRVSEVFRPPYHPYAEALLSAVPTADPTERKERIRLEGSVPSAIDPPQGCRFHTRCPRKIGEICETTPPEPTIEGDHAIFCHIPRRDLLRQQIDLG